MGLIRIIGETSIDIKLPLPKRPSKVSINYSTTCEAPGRGRTYSYCAGQEACAWSFYIFQAAAA